MSHRWKVDLQADGYYTELASSFDGEDISLEYHDDPETAFYPYAYSSHLDSLTDLSPLMERLVALELLLNGSLRLVYGADIYFSHPVRFREVWSLDSGQRWKVEASLPDESPFDDAVVQASSETTPTHPVACLIAKSRGDEGLRTLMMQVGLLGRAGPLFDWGSLYRVYDTVRTLASGKNLDPYVYVPAKKIEEFTAACNNMSILGLSARHGLTSNKPPKRVTTSLHEATQDVMAMARALLPTECSPKEFMKAPSPDRWDPKNLF